MIYAVFVWHSVVEDFNNSRSVSVNHRSLDSIDLSMLWHDKPTLLCSTIQSQTAVTAHLKSKQLLCIAAGVACVKQRVNSYILTSRDHKQYKCK